MCGLVDVPGQVAGTPSRWLAFMLFTLWSYRHLLNKYLVKESKRFSSVGGAA